jgi:hypothetical protein
VKINNLISKKNIYQISITIVVLIVTIIIIKLSERSQFQFEIQYFMLLFIMVLEGYMISSIIIQRIYDKTKHIRRIRTSPKIQRNSIGRPLEYIFFSLLFVATICISTALVEKNYALHIIYYALGVLFYSTAIFSGWGHYMKKLHD